jgi:hypothetical protein
MKKNVSEKKRIVLVVCFICCLTLSGLLLYAQQPATLGQVVANSNAVLIDNRPVPSGTTVVSGDKIQAVSGPVILSLLNGGRIELAKGGSVTLRGNRESVTLTGLAGSSRFYFPQDISVSIKMPTSVISANPSSTPLSGTLFADKNQLVFVADRGNYTRVDNNNSPTPVGEGQSTLVLDPKDQNALDPKDPNKPGGGNNGPGNDVPVDPGNAGNGGVGNQGQASPSRP